MALGKLQGIHARAPKQSALQRQDRSRGVVDFSASQLSLRPLCKPCQTPNAPVSSNEWHFSGGAAGLRWKPSSGPKGSCSVIAI